jgi:hypothetical protein
VTPVQTYPFSGPPLTRAAPRHLARRRDFFFSSAFEIKPPTPVASQTPVIAACSGIEARHPSRMQAWRYGISSRSSVRLPDSAGRERQGLTQAPAASVRQARQTDRLLQHMLLSSVSCPGTGRRGRRRQGQRCARNGPIGARYNPQVRPASSGSWTSSALTIAGHAVPRALHGDCGLEPGHHLQIKFPPVIRNKDPTAKTPSLTSWQSFEGRVSG